MPSAFETGQRMGMEAVQAGSSQAQVALRTREARREFDVQSERQQNQDEITNRMNEERQGMIRGDYMMKQHVLMQEMQRLTRAENAFNQFQTELNAANKGAPDFPAIHSDMVLRYSPTIAEHEQVLRKFDALNKAVKDGTNYATTQANEIGLQQLVRDLAVYQQGAKAMAVQADVKAGKISATEGIVALTSELETAKAARELAAEERKIAGQERVAEKRAGVSQQKAEQTVDVETKGQDGAIIKRRLTAEQYQKEQDAQREQSEVASLVRTYTEESGRFWGKEEGKSKAAQIAARLRSKGYDIDGTKLNSSGAKDESDPMDIYGGVGPQSVTKQPAQRVKESDPEPKETSSRMRKGFIGVIRDLNAGKYSSTEYDAKVAALRAEMESKQEVRDTAMDKAKKLISTGRDFQAVTVLIQALGQDEGTNAAKELGIK